MIKKSVSLLYSLDLFGKRVELLQKKEEEHHTLTGAVISLGIIIFTSISFLNMVIDLFSYSSPNIVSKVESTPNPQPFDINPDNFFLGIGISDKIGLPIINENEVYFESKILACTQQLQANGGNVNVSVECVTLSMKLCNSVEISQKMHQQLQLSLKELQFLYCPDYEQWKKSKIQLAGLVTSDRFSYIALDVKICNNQTSSNKCANIDEIYSKMIGGFIQISLVDQLLDQTQKENPYNLIKKNIITSYSTLNQRYVQLNYRHSYIKTIENLFYYNPSQFENHVLQFQDQIESQNPPNSETNAFFLLHIFLDEKQITYYRTYDNIFNILGSIGGLLDTLVFLSAFIVAPLTKFSQNIFLVNSIFAFEQEQQTSQNQIHPNSQLLKQSRSKSIIQLIDLSRTNDRTIRKQQSSNNLKDLKHFLNQKEKRISLNGIEQFQIFCRGQKKKQIQFGLDKILQKLDITFIIWKLIEIDKLKMVLFNDEQLKLFDYLPKPTIPLLDQQNINEESRLTEFLYFKENKTFEIKVKEALEAYKLSKYSQNELSQKLVNLMDNQIKTTFDIILEDKNIKQNEENQQLEDIDRIGFKSSQ